MDSIGMLQPPSPATRMATRGRSVAKPPHVSLHSPPFATAPASTTGHLPHECSEQGCVKGCPGKEPDMKKS